MALVVFLVTLAVVWPVVAILAKVLNRTASLIGITWDDSIRTGAIATLSRNEAERKRYASQRKLSSYDCDSLLLDILTPPKKKK